MDDLISRQAAINALGEKPLNWTDSLEEIYAEQTWIDNVEALKSLHSIGAVSIEVYKQVVWERDIAIGQLKELGYSLGEKIQSSIQEEKND